MPNISDIKAGHNIKALVYGRPKEGKTFGAGTFPRPNFIECDPNGIKVLAPHSAFHKAYPDASVIYEQFMESDYDSRGVVRNPKAFDQACRYFDACMKPNGSKWQSSDGKIYNVHPDMFDTWVIDTGTTLSEYAMNKALVFMQAEKLSFTHNKALASGIVIPKIQDYGAERNVVEQFITMVLSTDKNVLFLCHEKETTNDEGHLIAINPLLTGKGVQSIALMFSEIWYLRSYKSGKEIVRALTTQTDGIRMAASALGIPSGTEFNYSAITNTLKTT